MSKPFQILLGFTDVIDTTPGKVMVVDISVNGVDPDLDKNDVVVEGLAYVLAMHIKSMADAPPDQLKQVFLNFMAEVWANTPAPMAVDFMGSEVADA